MLDSKDSHPEPFWMSTNIKRIEPESSGCCFTVTITPPGQIDCVRLLVVYDEIWTEFTEVHFDLCPFGPHHFQENHEIPRSKAQSRRLRPASSREESHNAEKSNSASFTVVLKMEYNDYDYYFDLLPLSSKDYCRTKWKIVLDCKSPATQMNPSTFHVRGLAFFAATPVFFFPVGHTSINIHPTTPSRRPGAAYASNLPPVVIKAIFRMPTLEDHEIGIPEWSTVRELLDYGLVCKAWLVAREIFFESLGQFRMADINLSALSDFLDDHPELTKHITSFDTEMFAATIGTSIQPDNPAPRQARQTIASIIARSPCIKTLQTTHSFLPMLKLAIPHVSSLNTLVVDFKPFWQAKPPCTSFDDFFAAINSATRLEELQILNLEYPVGTKSHQTQPLTTHLKSLRVMNCQIHEPLLLKLISGSAGQLRSLYLQYLDPRGISNQDLRAALSTISQSLEKLWLCDFQFTPPLAVEYQEQHALEAVLPQMAALTELHVKRQGLSPFIIAGKSPREGTSCVVDIVEDGTGIIWDKMRDISLLDAMETTGWTEIRMYNDANLCLFDVNDVPVHLLAKQANEVAIRRGIKFTFATNDDGRWRF